VAFDSLHYLSVSGSYASPHEIGDVNVKPADMFGPALYKSVEGGLVPVVIIDSTAELPSASAVSMSNGTANAGGITGDTYYYMDMMYGFQIKTSEFVETDKVFIFNSDNVLVHAYTITS
jgi:hypothetical protein